MNIDLVKWELEILLKQKNEKELSGRTINYEDQTRIIILREFLDGIDAATIDIKKVQSNEVPF